MSESLPEDPTSEEARHVDLTEQSVEGFTVSTAEIHHKDKARYWALGIAGFLWLAGVISQIVLPLVLTEDKWDQASMGLNPAVSVLSGLLGVAVGYLFAKDK